MTVAVSILPDTLNAPLFPAFSPRNGSEPNFGRAKVGEMYDELANASRDPNATGGPIPRIPLPLPHFDYRSEMMQRDGLGQKIETGVTIGAPLAVGGAIGATRGANVPETLRNLGALPEIEATASVSNAARATADVRKFSEYIFTPNSKGKDVVFRGLGYSEKDSAMLTQMWEKQAAEKFAAGDYTLGVKDRFGQRVTIEIRLEGTGAAKGKVSFMKSGWMAQEDGTIKLNTPFTGFTR